MLVLVLAVLGCVIQNRRTDAPWARAFRYYLTMASIIIVLRVLFRSVFASGVGAGDHIVLTLPLLHTPSWYAGIRLGGPVSLESTLSAAIDGLRLGALLCCVGAANALANPRRALRVLPGALYELGIAVVVAITVAPQMVEALQRVVRARRLRAGGSRGLRAVQTIVTPVLDDAFERSLRLAASMDSRGYGRAGHTSRSSRRITTVLLLSGMLGLCTGVYGLLDSSTPRFLGMPILVGGMSACAVGLAAGSRRIRRSKYRPDRWLSAEWMVAGSGVVPALVLTAVTGRTAADLSFDVSPLHWPALPLLPAVAVVFAATAAFTAPAPPHRPVGVSGRPAELAR